MNLTQQVPARAQVVVTGSFDDLRSHQIRFLQEASKRGEVTVLLWSDATIRNATGSDPKFSFQERRYFLEGVRFVHRVVRLDPSATPDELPENLEFRPSVWVDAEESANDARRGYCAREGMVYEVIPVHRLMDFPELPAQPNPAHKKVIVTGCYDWFHSGHVRFFEEVSAHGDLYVVVGHDANIRLLKGAGHPLLNQEERRYMVGSIRYVTQALISSGSGWLDAGPEIQKLKPDIYAVNEDGDKGGKREYCLRQGIEYLVLKRTPAPGLPARSSTHLRGF